MPKLVQAITMNTKQLFSKGEPTKTVFQRKNGVLRALQVKIKNNDPHANTQKPMFPIARDRDEPNK